MIKVVFFDLGGVVFTDFFSGAEVEFSRILGVDSNIVLKAYVATDVREYCKGEISDYDRWKAFVDTLGLPEEKISICIDEFYRSYKPFIETVDFLKQLKKKNSYKLGILSDQPIIETEYLWSKYQNVFDLFDSSLVIISAQVRLSKKDPNVKIYKLAIEKAHVLPEEILFVDNSLHNIEAAQQEGMKTYFFNIKDQAIPMLLKGLQRNL